MRYAAHAAVQALAIGLAALAGSACTTSQRALGPLPVRNQHPAQLTILHLDPASAELLPAGAAAARVSFAYSSLFLAGTGNGNTFAMDGELLRSSLQVRTGLGQGFEFGAELPVLHTTGGFLDSFLIDYHRLFGFPDQDRDTTPKNRFRVFADHQGDRVYELREEPIALGDVPLTLAYGLIAPGPGRPGLALRGGFELPTGDADRGFGNGRVDYGGGVDATWPLAWGTVHAGARYTAAGSPPRARAVGFRYRDVVAASAVLEVPLLDDLSGFVQAEWETSTLRSLGVGRGDGDQMLLWLGGRLRVDADLFVEVGLGEDLLSFVSPDFSAWISFAWLPSAVRRQ